MSFCFHPLLLSQTLRADKTAAQSRQYNYNQEVEGESRSAIQQIIITERRACFSRLTRRKPPAPPPTHGRSRGVSEPENWKFLLFSFQSLLFYSVWQHYLLCIYLFLYFLLLKILFLSTGFFFIF